MKTNRSGQSNIFSNKDWAKTLAAIENQRYKLLFLIAFYTGERWGAILQLRWEDIGKHEITYRASTRKADPNGKRTTRTIPIHPALADAIASYPLPKSGLLFPSPNNPNKPISFDAAFRYFKRIMEKAGLCGYSTHSTRRTFITSLARAGANLKELQALTGHQSMETLTRYIEEDPERKRQTLLLL